MCSYEWREILKKSKNPFSQNMFLPKSYYILGNIGKNALTLMRRRAMSIRLFQLNLVPKFFICIGLLLIHRIIIILCIFDRVCLLSETSKISLIFPVCWVVNRAGQFEKIPAKVSGSIVAI